MVSFGHCRMDELPVSDQRSRSTSRNNGTAEANNEVRQLTLFWENFLSTHNEAQRVSGIMAWIALHAPISEPNNL